MPVVGDVDWNDVRAALEEATGRAAGLLRTIRHPRAPALGEWDVAELAAHLSDGFDIVTRLALGSSGPVLEELRDLSALTRKLVVDEPERDLDVLAGRIEAAAATFLSATASASGDTPCPWMVAGSTLPLSALACHLLNEVTVHGYDIATADGQRWKVDRAHAALILEGFIVPVVEALDARTLVHADKAAGRSLRYDLRLRGGGRFAIVFRDGAMVFEPASQTRVDCHLSVDPAAFLLVAWNRISQWQAIPKGQLLAWGRRPWAGLQLRAMIHTP